VPLERLGVRSTGGRVATIAATFTAVAVTPFTICDLRASGLRWHQRSIGRRFDIHAVNLRSKSQPALSEVKMRELALRVGHGVGFPEVFVCACAEFVAVDHGPRQQERGQAVASKINRREDSAGEALKSISARSWGLVGDQPYRARQGRAALHAAVSDILKIVGFDAVSEPCRRDGCDYHPMSAMWTGEKESWQARR
jgi:hypothetical protein